MENQVHNIILNFKSKKLIPVCLLTVYFAFLITVYAGTAPFTAEKIMTCAGFSFLWLTMAFFFIIRLPRVHILLHKYMGLINGLVLILTPLASFFMIEIMVGNYNLKMFRNYSFYNIIWYAIICYLIYALTRSSRLTVMLGIVLVYLAGLANYLVYLFRGNPILPSDILAWQTGMSVASGYRLYASMGLILATLLMFAVYTLGHKLEKPERRPSVISRLAVVGIYTAFAVMVFHAFFDTDLIKSKIRVIDFFAPKYTYMDYGTAFGFVANVKAMETDIPQGYSSEKVKEAFLSRQQEADSLTGTVSGNKPNIIVIMSEAFSDLRLVANYQTNMDYLPNIRALSENTVKGSLYTSVFGGATSNTEYEFLTGNSMAVLPRNSVPYQQYITDPTDSLVSTLKAQGYYNIAIHPYKPSGYKRDLVYPLLGFDEFLSADDFIKPQKIRSFISDRESFQKIIEEYEKKEKGQPVFIFNVTMQNHGGYSSSRIFAKEETVRFTDLRGYKQVEQYLSLIRESDKAFQSLIDYFDKQEEPTVILLFGDHQPIAYSAFYDKMKDQDQINLLKYKVPFVLWANYDIEEDTVDKMSANFLSSYLLKTAGLKGTAYNDYLLSLYEKLPVINAWFYITPDNQLHGYSEITEYSDLIKEYKYIGYNAALDKQEKLQQYFYLE